MRNRRFALAAAAAGTLLAMVPATAQEVAPERDRAAVEGMDIDGPRTTEGIESIELIGTTPLAADAAALDRYVLRARVVTVAPGGQIGLHRHEGRSGVVYFLSGEMTEYRDGSDDGITRREGDTAFETAGVTHWWRNESEASAVALVVDALPEE